MRMRGSLIGLVGSSLLALLGLSSGCSTTGSAEVGIRRNREAVAATMAAPKGAVQAALTVSHTDGSPVPFALVRAIDAEERVLNVATDELGRAPVALWSQAIAVWRVGLKRADGSIDWQLMSPCRMFPADGNARGLRIACTVEPNGGGM